MTTETTTWGQVRALFPCCRELAYLNTATYGPGPEPVVREVRRALDAWADGTGNWRAWEDRSEDARRGFARLLGASPESIALLPTVSAAAATVGAGLAPPSAGRSRIVVGHDEFRSNLYPWLAEERRGFEVEAIPFRDGALRVEDLARAIDERTALVAVSTVQSSNGYRVPLEPLAAVCRESGAQLYLDGTQSVGALGLDLDGVDYLAVSGYKWLLAPRGTTYLYVAPSHRGELSPMAPGWKTPTEPYAEYYGPPYDVAPRASGLDYSLAWTSWVGAAAALEFLLDIGLDAIEERNLQLASMFREGLASCGLQPLFAAEYGSQIIGLPLPDARAAEEALQARGVVAAVRHGYLRASFHFFNDETDVERALEALRSI